MFCNTLVMFLSQTKYKHYINVQSNVQTTLLAESLQSLLDRLRTKKTLKHDLLPEMFKIPPGK